MKIRKVDDKPMVIHTKEKAKIHAHEPKGAKIKGSNIYTVERGPKTAGAKVTNTDRKKSYRKSTIHQSESKNKGLSRFKRNYRESKGRICKICCLRYLLTTFHMLCYCPGCKCSSSSCNVKIRVLGLDGSVRFSIVSLKS